MKAREIVKDLLVNLVVFIVLYGGFVSFYMIVYVELPWVFSLLALPFFGLYAARKWVRVPWVFFAIHGLCLTLPFLYIRSAALFFALMLFALLSVLYSIRVRTKNEWRFENKHVFYATASLGVMFFLVTAVFGGRAEDSQRFFFAAVLIAIAAALLSIQMDNVDNRINALPARLKHSAPARHVLTANNILISGFLALLMAFGLLSLFAPNIWRVLYWVAYGAVYVLYIIFNILAIPLLIFSDNPPPETSTPERVDEGDLIIEFEPFDDAAVFTLESVMRVIAFIFLFILILYALRVGFKALMKNFFNKNAGDENESLMPDDALGKLKFVFGDFSAFLPRFHAAVKDPVRRLFIKKVNAHIKKGAPIAPSDTPDMIADKIRPREDIDALTALYEGVRYGAGSAPIPKNRR